VTIRTNSSLAAILLLAATAGADTSRRPSGFLPREAAVAAQTDAHRGRVTAIAFTPDARQVMTIGIDSAFKTWSLAMKPIDSVERQFRGDRLDVSPDGKVVVGVGVDNQSVVIYDRARKEVVTTIGRAWGINKCFALSPDGKSVVMMQNDGQARVFGTADGAEKSTFQGARHTSGAMAWSKDGKMVATVGFNRIGRVVNPATGEDIVQLEGAFTQARDLCFSPDGKSLMVADFQGSVRLFDPKTGKETATLATKAAGQKCGAYSMDGKFVAVGEQTGVIRIYEVKTGRELREIRDAHAAGVWSLAFSPDGRLLASGGGDGKVKLWGSAGSPAPQVKPDDRQPGYLGITGAWDDTAKGVTISTIIAGSAAEKAGMQVGDVILEIGGKAFEDFEGLRALVTSKKEGEEVELKLNRAGEEKKLKLKLGPKPPE